ncbi:hypothetical protein PAENIP36_55220 [Paenibacillus sp. P36]
MSQLHDNETLSYKVDLQNNKSNSECIKIMRGSRSLRSAAVSILKGSIRQSIAGEIVVLAE